MWRFILSVFRVILNEDIWVCILQPRLLLVEDVNYLWNFITRLRQVKLGVLSHINYFFLSSKTVQLRIQSLIITKFQWISFLVSRGCNRARAFQEKRGFGEGINSNLSETALCLLRIKCAPLRIIETGKESCVCMFMVFFHNLVTK